MQQKGFFGSLFDISFKSLVTSRAIPILYVLALIVIGLMTVVFLLRGISAGGSAAVFTIIIVPLVALLYTILARVSLEALVILFNISENTREMVRVGGGRPSSIGQTLGSGGLGAGGAAPAGGGQQPAAAAAPAAAAPSGGQAPGWYPDPQGQKRLRYFDGSAWTEHTSD